VRLQGANRHLRERLQDALQELEAAHAQLRILNGLQQRLEHATPGAAELAAAALEQERALQAARDAQVLQLLRAKVRCRGCCRWLPPSAEMSCKPPCCWTGEVVLKMPVTQALPCLPCPAPAG
jgi:hypothetical protein